MRSYSRTDRDGTSGRNVTYDIVVMLQPTSPLEKSSACPGTLFSMLIEGDWDAAGTVSETDSKNHPLKQLTVNSWTARLLRSGGQADHRPPTACPRLSSQRRRLCYQAQLPFGPKEYQGGRTGAFVLEGELVSIDTYWDLELVEFIYSKQQNPEY